MPDRNDLRGAHYTYRPIGGGVMVSQLELYGGEEGGRGEGVWSCQPKDKPKPGLGDFQ